MSKPPWQLKSGLRGVTAVDAKFQRVVHHSVVMSRYPEENFDHASDSFFPTPVPSKNTGQREDWTFPRGYPDSIEVVPLQSVAVVPDHDIRGN
jgi:hypothetical protein